MRRSLVRADSWVVLALTQLLVGCGDGDAQTPTKTHTDVSAIATPAGFPTLSAPADNLPTRERVELGRRLFYDARLSRTGDVACSSCHLQANAFADPNRLSAGVDGQLGTRNAPALVNLAWGRAFFWHGGAASLEVQAVGPIKNPVEMDMSLLEVAERLNADAELAKEFERAYAEPATESSLTRALASFVRSLVSADSPYDHYLAGDTSALSEAAVRGEKLFNGEGGECFHCHIGFDLSNHLFRNNGIAADDPDEGRREVTLKDSDLGRFKVPTLRNVAVSAPYMHDGSLATLDDVIDAYVAGGRGHPNTDPTIHPLDLSADDRADLRAFLEALTDEQFLTNPDYAEPK
jgi:cytochrome c peroxidase